MIYLKVKLFYKGNIYVGLSAHPFYSSRPKMLKMASLKRMCPYACLCSLVYCVLAALYTDRNTDNFVTLQSWRHLGFGVDANQRKGHHRDGCGWYFMGKG